MVEDLVAEVCMSPYPSPRSRHKYGLVRVGLIPLEECDFGFPRRLGRHHKMVDVRDDTDFMALDLVEAAAFMLRFGCGQTFLAFYRLAPFLPLQTRRQFSFITFEIGIDSIEFAAKIILLPITDGL